MLDFTKKVSEELPPVDLWVRCYREGKDHPIELFHDGYGFRDLFGYTKNIDRWEYI